MTIAEKVAEMLGDQGDRFFAEDGRNLHEIALEMGALVERHPENHCLTRYEFGDGSAIVSCEAYWGLEEGWPWSFAMREGEN